MLNIPEEIKQLFRKGSVRKNLRIHFPNGEREDITNENLVAESFSFEESICSENTLKFGLSEASSVEFETVGVGNIKGYEIKVFHEIDISSLPENFISEYGTRSEDLPFPYYKIPYGYFTVNSCQRQTDINRRKITAYDKLLSESLDYDKTEEINNYLKSKPACVPKNVYTLEKMMLQDFNINYEKTEIPVVEEKRGGIAAYTYRPTIISINGTRTNISEVHINVFNFDSFDVSEIYNVLFSNLDEFSWVQQTLKGQAELYEFTIEGDWWWLDHGLQIELVDSNGKQLVFTENDAVGDILSILGCGNIVEARFMYINNYIIYFYDDWNDEKIFEVSRVNRPTSSSEMLLDYITIEKLELYDIEKKTIPPVLTSCTLRNVLNAVYEINGTFATINRESGMLEEKKIGGGGLYPSETLYPSNDLFPKGMSVFTKSMYKSAWYDDEYTPIYSKITCTYKNSDTSEKEYLEYVIVEVEEGNENNYQTYDISENYIIKEFTFTELEILKILTTLAFNIKDIKYMPAEIDLMALPYLESGEIISVLTTDGGFETIVLNRTLSGIQSLFDNYESRG